MADREDQRQVNSPLVGEGGSTEITDSVVSKIASMAAGEVEGIRLGGSASRAAGGLLGSVTGSQGQTRGVSVDVGRVEAAIDLTMGIEYGRNILELVGRVRARVTEQVENLTGLRITELNVTVSDIIFPEQEEDGEDRRQGRGQQQGRGRQEERDQGRGEIEGAAGQEDRPQARRTEEYRTDEYRRTEDQERAAAVRRRETADASDADTVSDATAANKPTNPSNAGSRTGGRARAGDREEVRVEGDPLDEDETRELRLGDEETDRTRRIPRDDEAGREDRRDR
jgi:uncharacterized alkaline shock family protein YloU